MYLCTLLAIVLVNNNQVYKHMSALLHSSSP